MIAVPKTVDLNFLMSGKFFNPPKDFQHSVNFFKDVGNFWK